MSDQISPRNRAERRMHGKKARAAGAVLTAGSAALAMGAAWVGPSGMQAAGAASFSVTSATDDGNGDPGTLSKAINDANAAPGADVITFSVPGGVIDVSGDLPTITDDVAITGPGSPSLKIDGHANALFYFQGAGTSTISGLEVTNGLAIGHGGAIVSQQTDLTVEGLDIHGNSAAAGRDGGGIAAFTHGSLVVSNTRITGNIADDDGGGIALYALDSASVVNSYIVNNQAGSDGGGIYDFGYNTEGGRGTITITGSFIADNDAVDNGGGVYVTMTQGATVSGSTVTRNTAGAEGGGVGFDDIYGLVAIQDSTISSNSADGAGGGAYFEDTYAGVSITGSTVSGNTAGDWGGGMYFTEAYQFVTVTDTTIAGNTAAQGGGGVQLYSDVDVVVTVTDSTISGNTGLGSGGGGWIQWTNYGSASFNNSTITGNTANGEGGGLYLYGAAAFSVNQSTITGNSGVTTGGLYLGETKTAQSVGAAKAQAKAAKVEAVNDRAAEHGRTARAEKVREQRVHAAATGAATVTLSGTILWGNSGDDFGGNGTGTLTHDLLGTVAATISQVDQGGNLLGVDPLLGPLASNGGATQTMELLVGSPAINAGPDPVAAFSGNEFDQRGAGFPRVTGATVDIGAFEVQPVQIAPKFTG